MTLLPFQQMAGKCHAWLDMEKGIGIKLEWGKPGGMTIFHPMMSVTVFLPLPHCVKGVLSVPASPLQHNPDFQKLAFRLQSPEWSHHPSTSRHSFQIIRLVWMPSRQKNSRGDQEKGWWKRGNRVRQCAKKKLNRRVRRFKICLTHSQVRNSPCNCDQKRLVDVDKQKDKQLNCSRNPWYLS